jgi:hypothetical protein
MDRIQMNTDIDTAARALHEAIFDGRHDQGNILVGQHKLTVFIYGPYYGTKPQIWQGYHVDWRTNVGLPVAQPIAPTG